MKSFAWVSTYGLLSFLWLLLPMMPADAEELIVRPRPQAGPLDNPLKGWCPYTNAGEIQQPYSMVFQYISWRELEPAENDFRFDEWEQSWNDKAGTDKHVVFRVYVDYPSKPSGLPDWLRKAGVKETAYDEHGGGESPNYDDPRLLAAMERLIAALGKRFNDHPRIAFVQLGLLGFWGEWHTFPRKELSASAETERRVIQAYRNAFPDKCLMVRYATGYAGEQEWIGFHDDMFPEDTDHGKDWSFLALCAAKRTENWKVSGVGGEMVPGQAQQWLGADFDTTLEMASRAHFTWVGPYCPALTASKDDLFMKRSEQLVRPLGYEFQLTEVAANPAQVKTKQVARFSLKGSNQGVAPFYYPWSVEWALFDPSGKLVALQKTPWDIRKWQPGPFAEDVGLSWDVPAGRYRLGLGIRDPWKDRPAIRFANELPVAEGWTLLSELHVSD